MSTYKSTTMSFPATPEDTAIVLEYIFADQTKINYNTKTYVIHRSPLLGGKT